jgi:adenylate cyclase
LGAHEEGTLAALKAIRRELGDPKVKEHHLLLEFSIVVVAVRCAVEVQRQMAERNADVPPERRIEFRMGVNLGDVIRDGRDIFGDGVNIAARMEALAEPGGIDVSGMVYDQVRDKLDVAFDDLGDQRNLANARYLRSPPIPMLFLTT